ncbi:PQQ-binding-like beta-propeller repeat protein, partial [Flavobacterium oreochromis]
MLGIDKVFSEINSFTLNNENDYVIIKDSILEINSKFELKLLAVSNDLLQEITYSNNVVFSNKVNGGSILFKKKLFEFNNFFIKKIINHNEFLASKNGKTILFSFHNNLEMVEFDFKVFTFFQEKDFLFIKKGKKIEKYSLNNIYQKSLWQTDISQIGKHIPFPDEEEKEGEVKNFVGVYNNELIVQLTGGKFIGLDLENGKVNWEQNLVENNLTNQVIDYNFGDPYNPFLDEENGKIYILQGEVFIVFDLLTKKATYQWSSLNLPTEDYVFIR